MSNAKHSSKRKRLMRKAVPTVGIAGMSLAMAGGASAATTPPTANLSSQHIPLSHEIILGEEEISDVSLGTFYVFDKENAASELGKDMQLAAGRGCGGCGGRGCGGARGCGGRGCGCARGCGRGCGWGGCGCWAAALWLLFVMGRLRLLLGPQLL